MPKARKNPRIKRNTPRKRTPSPRRPRSTYDRRPHDEVAEFIGCFRVLALDVSSVAVGWSVFEDGALVDYGCYYQVGADHGERLGNFREWLRRTLEDLTPTHLCYEAPYPGRQRHAFGVLQLYIAQVLAAHFAHYFYEVPEVNRVPAADVKRLNTLPKGLPHKVNKRVAVERVNAWWGLDLRYADDHHKAESDDDIADAILLNQAWHTQCHPELLEPADV